NDVRGRPGAGLLQRGRAAGAAAATGRARCLPRDAAYLPRLAGAHRVVAFRRVPPARPRRPMVQAVAGAPRLAGALRRDLVLSLHDWLCGIDAQPEEHRDDIDAGEDQEIEIVGRP